MSTPGLFDFGDTATNPIDAALTPSTPACHNPTDSSSATPDQGGSAVSQTVDDPPVETQTPSKLDPEHPERRSKPEESAAKAEVSNSRPTGRGTGKQPGAKTCKKDADETQASADGNVRPLRLDLIRIDGDTQPREALDSATMDDYSERMVAGDAFPPLEVLFDGSKY